MRIPPAVATQFFTGLLVGTLFLVYGFGRVAAAQVPSAPHISSVSPDPPEGSIEDQWLTINGRGFVDSFAVRLRSKGVDALIDNRSSLEFISSNEVRVQATFGTGAHSWSAQVINSGGAASNVYEFGITAPIPHIEVMRPVERTEGQPGFALTIYGSTIAPYSVIRWNGREVPTTPLKTSDNPNALTIGLRAKIPASAIAEAGRNEVRVYTPPPGGGLSPPMVLFANPRPFHQTIWFYLLFVAGLVLVGLAMHWYRVKNVREKKLERQVEARTQHLRAEKQKTEAQAAQLRKQAEQLRELDRAKSRFLANLSHEFRTPLTMILEPTRDLLTNTNGTLNEETRRQLGTVERNARQMQQLIEQLLALSRLENGRVRLQPSRGDLVGFVEAVVRSFRPLAERRGVTLQEGAAVPRLEAAYDGGKLRMVLDNLLSNALKFTPEGGRVVITVAEAGDQALIRVRDTGPGIPEEKLQHIFDRFYQVDGSATREHEGTGIGLSVAKELVELHGGTIHAESEEDTGATFTVALPLAREGETERRGEGGRVGVWRKPEVLKRSAENGSRGEHEAGNGGKSVAPIEGLGAEDETPPTRPHAHPPKPTILIVEDNADVRTYLQRHFAADYRVKEACNGAEALDVVREEPPDLVVSDVMMPEMDGIELCRTLKADEELGALPVLLLTARAGEDERVEGLQTGADDYVEKPFSVAELTARIENLIASRRALRERYGRAIVMEPTGVSITPEDEAFYEKACAVIERHMKDGNFGVERFADEVGVSKSTLNRRLKAATGLTPAAFIRELRMQRAVQLLEQDPDLHVYEVADAVGYRRVDHFSRVFRDAFGTSPAEYPPGRA